MYLKIYGFGKRIYNTKNLLSEDNLDDEPH